MFFLFIFVLFFTGNVNTQNAINSLNKVRIVGGTSADISEIPYIVSLKKLGVHVCGGSIIGPKAILTAAQCLRRLLRPTSISAGTSSLQSNGQWISIAKFEIHPKYNDGIEKNNDIAIIFLQDPIKFGPNASPIKLPRQDEPVPVGKMVTASGWGSTKLGGFRTTQLQKVTLPIIKSNICKRLYDEPLKVTESMFCAGYKEGGTSACRGDSGGPLVYNDVLIGITSWSESCGNSGKPGVYTMVARFRNWINCVLRSSGMPIENSPEITQSTNVVVIAPETIQSTNEDSIENVPQVIQSIGADTIENSPETILSSDQGTIENTSEVIQSIGEDNTENTPEMIQSIDGESIENSPEVIQSIDEGAIGNNPETITGGDIIENTPETIQSNNEDNTDNSPETIQSTNEDSIENSPEIIQSINEDTVEQSPEIIQSTNEDTMKPSPEIVQSTNEDTIEQSPETVQSTNEDIMEPSPETIQ